MPTRDAVESDAAGVPRGPMRVVIIDEPDGLKAIRQIERLMRSGGVTSRVIQAKTATPRRLIDQLYGPR
jgi:hypothetical protein